MKEMNDFDFHRGWFEGLFRGLFLPSRGSSAKSMLLIDPIFWVTPILNPMPPRMTLPYIAEGLDTSYQSHYEPT
jgi:hypothetical protein